MPREIAVGGLFMPSLLPIFIGVALLYWLVDMLLAQTGLYRQVWHPALFRLSLFVCLLGLVAAFFYR